MTIQKLVLLHTMSSSSDALHSKKFLEERKQKLKQGLEEKRASRTIVRPQINKIHEDDIDDIDDDGENVIPKPPSSLSGGGGGGEEGKAGIGGGGEGKGVLQDRRRNRARSLTVTRTQKPVPMRQPTPTPIHPDPILSIGSSSSTLDSAASEVPSAHIKKLFQRALAFDTANDNCRGRTLVQRAIEEQQAKIFKDDQNENNKKKEEVEKDLRSLYQTYLSGKVEKECVMRSGKEWTSRYRLKRLQEIKKKKQQERSTTASEEATKKSDDSTTKTTTAPTIDTSKNCAVARRYQKKSSRISFRPTTMTQTQTTDQKS